MRRRQQAPESEDRPQQGGAPRGPALKLVPGGSHRPEGPGGPAASGGRPPGAEAPATPGPRGTLVEGVRVIIVGLGAAGGWQVVAALGTFEPRTHVVGAVVGSGVGYVLGGAFGRKTAAAVSDLEREFRRRPAADILAGGIGLILGLVLATLLSVPLYRFPNAAAYPAVAFTYLTVGYFAWSVGRLKAEELFGLFGVKVRAAGTRPGEVSVLDSSAILDGRLMALVRMGFLGGTLLVPRRVVEEIHAVADSSNEGRRARGRRALDLLVTLRRDPSVEVVLLDEEEGGPPGEPVDSELVRVARRRGAVLITNDASLAKVAVALDVPVRSIHALADALRPQVVAGEQVAVKLTRRGRDHGQAVGYLDDGTMVVVEDADHLLGQSVSVTVTNALQTSTGQMVFARVAGADGSEGLDAAPPEA